MLNFQHDDSRIRTSAEVAAGVTPVNYAWPEGHIERYMTWVDATTDFTTACQAVAAVARQKPGLVIQFTPGRTYSVWPSGTGSTLFDLEGAIGIRVEGDGALLSAGNVNSSTPWVFDLRSAENVLVRNLRYTQTYTDLDSANGAHLFVIRQGSHRIKLENIRQTYGRVGIQCLGAASNGPRSDQIVAHNCEFNTVYYPQNFQFSGDQYFARGIRTINCGRGYFPYNVSQHDVDMFSQHGGPFDDCLLKVYCNPGEVNTLEQIKLRYYSDGRYASGETHGPISAIFAIEAQQNDAVTASAKFNDIDIQVHFVAGASPNTTSLLQFRKFDINGNPDTTARDHLFSNIRISGTVANWENADSHCVDLFSTVDGYNFTGDTAHNVRIAEFAAGSSNASQIGIRINGQPFINGRGVILENVITDMQITRENWTADRSFDATNVISTTIIARANYATYTPTFSSSDANASIGNGTVAAYYTRRGDRVRGHAIVTFGSTTTFGTGDYRVSLPVTALAGSEDYLAALYILDSGTAHYSGVSRVTAGATYVIGSTSGAATNVGRSSPITFASGDVIRFEFDYVANP